MSSPYKIAAQVYASVVDELNRVPANQRQNFLVTVFNIVSFMDNGVLQGFSKPDNPRISVTEPHESVAESHGAEVTD